MATCYTVFVNCIPLFQTHIVEDLGLTVGQFNTGVSITTVVAVFASLVIGKLTDKCSARVLGAVTVLTGSVVLVGLSQITAVWQLYALCVVAGMVVVAGTRLLVSVIISNWFTLKRGLAVSIALSGSGIGGVILSPATSAMIEASGWRAAFLLLAVVCLVAALPRRWRRSARARARRASSPTVPGRSSKRRPTARPTSRSRWRWGGRRCAGAPRSGCWSWASLPWASRTGASSRTPSPT